MQARPVRLGLRTLEPEQLKELVEGKFVDALRSFRSPRRVRPGETLVATRRPDAARWVQSSPVLISSQPASTTSVGAGVVAPSHPRAPTCQMTTTRIRPMD